MDSRTNYKNMLLVLLLVVAGLAGAMMPQHAAAKHKNPTPPLLSLSTKNVEAGYNGGEYKVTLSCNRVLRITRVDRPSWIGIGFPTTVGEYYKKKTITITVRPNRGDKRECKVVFKTTSGSVSLKVTQEAGEKVVFTVSPKELEVDAKGGDVFVQINGTERFTPRNPILPDWMDKSSASIFSHSDKIAHYKLTFKENEGDRREGMITFPTSEGDVTLKVTQWPPVGAGPVNLLGMGYKGVQTYVSISCRENIDITDVIVPSWMDWLDVIFLRRDSPGQLEYLVSCKPNSGAQREGVIIFKTTKGKVEVKVSQDAAGTDQVAQFTFDPKELKVDADGGEKEVTLSCNEPYRILDSYFNMPDWLLVSEPNTRDKAVQKITITIRENTGDKREGAIIFRTDKNNVVLKVTQEAAGTKPKAKFTLEPKELKVPAGGHGIKCISPAITILISKKMKPYCRAG